jgi:lipopolysaccharide heptosyltransferase II
MSISSSSSISILIIRLSSLGDVLLATPLLRAIRKSYPNARIDVTVAKKFAEVWKYNPYCSSVIEVDTTRSAFSGLVHTDLTGTKYDVVVDIQRNIRSLALRIGKGKTSLLIDKYRQQKRLLVKSKHLTSGDTIPHIVERYFQTVDTLGISNDGGGLELWLPEERNGSLTDESNNIIIYPPSTNHHPINKQSERRIAFAPGAHHKTKRWIPEYFAQTGIELSQKYGAKILLLGGKQEYELCEEIKQSAPEVFENHSGSTSLYDTARLLDTCIMAVSNDTGVLHIASARRIPVVAIYGSTVPALGFTPYGTTSVIVEQRDIACRPCSHIGRAECPLGHFNCMKLILPNDVISAVRKIDSAF